MSQQDASSIDWHDQIQARAHKCHDWMSRVHTYPCGVSPKHRIRQCHELTQDQDKTTLENLKIQTRICGRVLSKRIMGKASFIHVQDGSGRIQIYANANALGDEAYDDFKILDLGDIVEISGYISRTRTGELTIFSSAFKLLAKGLRPLPDKYHGLQDQQSRYRYRYLDTMVNASSRDIFVKRAAIIQAIRSYLLERDYLEVETPMLSTLPGGALAKPFVTHHQALDLPLYLRVAPELYLKRLIVGGFDRVFEINRCFRNEGISTKHNPEFTTIEFYQAYANYHDLMVMTQVMLAKVVQAACGSHVTSFRDCEIDWSQPFDSMTMAESLCKYQVIDEKDLNNEDVLRDLARNHGYNQAQASIGQLHLYLFEQCVEHQLMKPTFICQHPIEVSPLARANDQQPTLTDRFELFIGGMEIANGFSEINDPKDQASRFQAQVEQRQQGDDEAMMHDQDYIDALSYGMPPTAGQGIGIDRLTMLLCDVDTIKEVILFPLQRPIED